jgi:hypothetical protein
MSSEAVTYALLSGAAAITAIVGARIYPVQLPLAQPTPAIVYEPVSTWRPGALDAYAATHLERARVQVNVLSADHSVLMSIRAAVMAAMQFQRGVIGGVTVHSVLPGGEGNAQYDADLRLYFQPLDFILTYES